ncbi:MAG: IS4/IS5 family transposase [Hymenobacter sp.]|nr:MAG: IS4/IS5 family transposase [Hymenobacter sp.]
MAGRKRHVVVDTLGLPLAVQVQPASVQDPTGAPAVLAEAKQRAPNLQLLWGDGRDGGPTVAAAATAVGLRVEVVKKPPDQKGFQVLPYRWVVERTFGWFGKYRRLAGRDFETNPRNSETWIKLCVCNLLVRRLTSPLKWKRKKEYSS